MRPLRLTVENFAAFKDRQPVLDLGALDLFAIAGPTGSGKSSLLDAIVFALYGQIPRMGKSCAEMISLGRDRMAVTLDLRLGEREFRITRVARRKGASDAQIEELVAAGPRPLADGVRAVDAQVERLLRLRYDAFLQSVILPQGRFAEFLQSAPKKRREILRDLLRLQVYERMRERAAEQAKARAAAVQSLEERLAVDYADATPEALAGNQRAHAVLAAANAAATARLEEDTRRLEGLRVRRTWTQELCLKIREADRLAALEDAVATRERSLRDARRAESIVPLLEVVTGAEQRLVQEVERTRRAESVFAETTEAHRRAVKALEDAERNARELPRLDARLRILDEVAGLLGPREDARRRCEGAGEQHRQKQGERDEVARAAREAATASVRFESELKAAESRQTCLGYEAEAHRRLEALRDQAGALGLLRGAAERAARDSQEADEASGRAAACAAETKAAATGAAQRLTEAGRLREEAETALRGGETAHAAAHLRSALHAGDHCPVCEQAVEAIPAVALPPALETLTLRHTKAVRAEGAAREEDARARESAVRSAQSATQTREGAARAKDRAVESSRALLDAQVRLEQAMGGALGEEGSGTLEDRLRTHLARLDNTRDEYEAAREVREKASRALAEARHEHARLTETARGLADTAALLARQRDEAATELARLEARIAAVTQTDPATEREQTAARRLEVSEARDAAVKGERATELALREAETALTAAREARAEQSGVCATSRSRAGGAAREAGFDDAEGVRRAVLPRAEQEALAHDIEEHGRQRHAIEVRVRELAAQLGNDRVTEDQLQTAEAAVRDGRTALEGLLQEESALRERIQAIERRAEAGARLATDLEGRRRELALVRQVASDLKSDGFQAYLLEETFRELVAGASERLLRLSGRYALAYENDSFHVLDHDNARERRSAETLSGGETFLASLALALELSQQVQRTAGAVNLDSLFIDEGFGTLDPEALGTITEAIESLPVGGRMVGIITHLPALTERLPARIDVEKRPEGSRAVIHA